MFYALSKGLLFLLQPATWLAFLLILALLTKRRRVKRRALVSALLLFLLLGNPMIFNAAMQKLEWPPKDLKGEKYRYAIILGGHGEFNRKHKGLELNRAADRLMSAIELYHQGIVEQIIVSSGVSPKDRPLRTEARMSKKSLLNSGVPEEAIILEESSWNTHENAMYTAQLMEGLTQPGKSLLVTSAFHMERALKCFKKEGLDPVPYPVDYISGGPGCEGLSCVIPSLRVLMEWQVIIKEKVGSVVYGLKGYV